MTTTKLKGYGEIRASKVELDVPHLGQTLTFVLPIIGPGSHKNVMGKIDKQKLLRPTTAQLFSLIDLVSQNPDNEYCFYLTKRLNNPYLWTSTESLYFPEGYIAFDNIDGKMPNNSNDLMSLINEKDPRVRLVEPGFKDGFFLLKDFLKHPVLLAHIGEEMIPTVERVVKRLKGLAGGWINASDKSPRDKKRFTVIYTIGTAAEISLYCHGDNEKKLGYSPGIVDKSSSSS